jgi:Trk K+ transport system NAD-binding subunit
MDPVFFIIFRRMRRPLLTLVVTYAIAVLGLTLIPGQDADGNTWHMSFFHAFYFVSYMATTIGFGEIPYEFSDGQRLWVTFTVYATVVVWIYAIGTLLSLVQNKTFQQAVSEKRFTRKICALNEPFYLVCGYGVTGSELVSSLIEHKQHAVVIDIDQHRIYDLELDALIEAVPGLCADAQPPVHLIQAGLQHELCAGVVAVTNSNEANLKIAITSKMLNHDLQVICRADSHDIEANMASFGTDYIIDPYDTFGARLATALQAPCMYLLHQWLTGMADECLKEPVYPPVAGRWVICGYGRFGKAIYNRLQKEEIGIVVIEMTPEITGKPDTAFVHGRGTEAATLIEAGIHSAEGLVAGTDDDANNLSIIATAKEINPGLFTIARKNHHDNEALFDALSCNMVMTPSSIIANKIRALLVVPMLYEFLEMAYFKDDDWACELVSRISGAISDVVPDIWEVTIDETDAYAVTEMMRRGHEVQLADIQRDRYDPDKALNAVALLFKGKDGKTLLPSADLVLDEGDRLLFCGQVGIHRSMEWNLQNVNVLELLVTGTIATQSKLLRLFMK